LKFPEKISKENRLLILSLACGLIAAGSGYGFLTWKENNLMAGMNPVKVLAAAGYISANSEIDKNSVEFIELPAKFVTKAHITDIKQAESKLTIVPFIKGEPILMNKISDRGTELNMSIPTGLRAMTVSVDEESGVGFMIKPGDNVDILLTFETAENQRLYTATATILQSVKVIGVGANFKGNETQGDYNSITLALTQEEAEILTFAKDKGRINLALRPLGDRIKENVRLASFNDLMKQIKSNEKSEDELKKEYIMGSPGRKEVSENEIKPRM